MAADTRVFEFNGFRLDSARRVLAGRDGRPIPLKPLVFETLLHLVRRPGECLEKSELTRAVWGNLVVEENGLNQHISALRRAFGEKPGENRFIATVPRVGYRFVADVREISPAPVTPTSAKRGGLRDRIGSIGRNRSVAALSIIAFVAMATAIWLWRPAGEMGAERSIAVLPFGDLSQDGRYPFLSDGIAEGVLNRLAGIAELRVIAWTSSLTLRDKDLRISEIGEMLNVAYVLEGSVHRDAEDFRVTVRLVDVQDESPVWSQTYDRTIDDVFAIQEEVAADVIEQLQLEPAQTPRAADETDIETYSLYVQARYINHVRIRDSLPHARQLLEQAIDRDPDFALARYELAKTFGVMFDTGLLPQPDAVSLIEATIEAAAERWPDRRETIVWQDAALPWLRDGDLQAAAQALQRALTEAPDDIELLGTAAVLARVLNRPELVIAIGEYVIVRDPLCYGCRLPLMEAYNTVGQHERVRQLYLDGRGLDIDDGPLRGRYGTALLYEGEPQAALKQFETIEPWVGPAMRSALMAMAYHDLEMQAEFESAVSDARELHPGPVEWPAAMVYSYVGDLDAAFELLMEGLPEHGVSGMTPLDGPMGREMRQHPRWTDLAARVGLPDDFRSEIPFEIELPN